MTDLIKRLEEAEAGSRELDLAIWSSQGFIGTLGEKMGCVTTSLGAALALAERVLPGWSWMVRHYAAGQGGPGWTAYVCKPDTDLMSAGPVGSSPALALCIAVLKATDTGRE